jgi:hypothetical protein
MSDLTRGFTTTDGIELNEVLYGTVLPIVELYNQEELLDLRALLCSDHDESYIKFDASGQWKFQKLGEAEKPVSRKKVWGKMQKDTTKYGLDIGYTFDWLMSEIASSEEITRMANKAINRDRALQTTVILDECLTSGGFFDGSFTPNEVMNTPPTFGANVFTAAHNHYVGSGSATLTLATITAMKVHIKEHGYKGQLWGLMNSDMTRNVEDLAGWYGTTAGTTTIPGKVVDNVSIEGFAGRLLGVDWKETEWMPTDYLMIVGVQAEGGEKPVRYIQKKNPSAKGLILAPGSYDPKYPIIDADYIHWLEALIVLRGAGVVYYVNSTSSYSNPTVTTNVVEAD